MDIDIDFANRDRVLAKLQHRVARLSNDQKHKTGVYFTEVPHDPTTNMCTIDHKTAEQRGYFKVDMLNVHIYDNVRNEQHLLDLMAQEPLWELLEHSDFTDQVFHLSGYHDVCKKLKPNSIEKLACVLAIIRPAKRHLLDKSWPEIFEEVWKKPSDGQYYFKHSHAIGYATAVAVHINLLCEQLT